MPRGFTDAELEAIATRNGEPVERYQELVAQFMRDGMGEHDARERAANICDILPALRILAREED